MSPALVAIVVVELYAGVIVWAIAFQPELEALSSTKFMRPFVWIVTRLEAGLEAITGKLEELAAATARRLPW